jgi:predicted AAA+ superfamily ATPase
MHIKRELETYLESYFSNNQPRALILAGIVGSGKTTLVKSLLDKLIQSTPVFSYTGDDIRFRNSLEVDSQTILNEVRSRVQGHAIVFVDEVQKTEAVFDALKLCFDNGISFIVTGSNPAYLATIARKRLQRRADFLTMAPFSLPEILAHKGLIQLQETQSAFLKILDKNSEPEIPNFELQLSDEIKEVCERHLILGGLPTSFFETTFESVLRQIRATVERGFEVMEHDNRNISDVVRTSLALNHSREFTYQGIMQRTGVRLRDDINAEIKALLGHGYLQAKRPTFMGLDRRSYFCVYSYSDPGIVTYLCGDDSPTTEELGFRLEGAIHTRLEFLRQFVPFNHELSYFKPFTVDQNDKTKFGPGEIDFVYSRGKRHVPIEVKLTSNLRDIDTSLIERFTKQYKAPYGIVIYGGVPHVKKEKKMIYWPYWLV